MKKIVIAVVFFLSLQLHSQSSLFDYRGRQTLTVRKEKLFTANYLTDLSLQLWNKLSVPGDVRKELDRRRQEDIKLGYYMYPLGNDFDRFIEYESVEISVESADQILRANGSDDKLTTEQRAIIAMAGYGTDLVIKINFRFKMPGGDSDPDGKVYEGTLPVTVVPAVVAVFTGGNRALTKYVKDEIFSKLPDNKMALVSRAEVRFFVNEQGKVVEVSMKNSSTDPLIDKLIIESFEKMPYWRPAEDAWGKKVREELTIPFGRTNNGGDGC
jgi:hypothetical protein